MASEIQTLTYEIVAKDAAWPVLPIVMAKANDGEIVYVTPTAAETFGYLPSELIGEKVEILVPDQARIHHASVRQEVMESSARLMGSAKYRITASGDVGGGRMIHGLRKDGTTFPAVITLTSANILGSLIGIAFVVDVSTAMGVA